MFGPHLIFHGRGCSRRRLNSIDHLYQVLDAYPDKIQMTKIMPPRVQRCPDGGLSGVVIIAESHIAIHTKPDRGTLALDIFSCRGFNVKKAIRFAVGQFKIEEYTHKLFDRGEDYPRDEAASRELLVKDRKRLLQPKPAKKRPQGKGRKKVCRVVSLIIIGDRNTALAAIAAEDDPRALAAIAENARRDVRTNFPSNAKH